MQLKRPFDITLSDLPEIVHPLAAYDMCLGDELDSLFDRLYDYLDPTCEVEPDVYLTREELAQELEDGELLLLVPSFDNSDPAVIWQATGGNSDQGRWVPHPLVSEMSAKFNLDCAIQHAEMNASTRPRTPTSAGVAAAAALVATAIAPKTAAAAPTQADKQPNLMLVDIAHITGEEDFYLLSQQERDMLDKEIDAVQQLMDEFHQIVVNAGDRMSCLKLNDPQADCTCVRCQKEQWALKAQDAGLLRLGEAAAPPPEPRTLTSEDIQGQLRAMRQARDWYHNYTPLLLKDGFKGSTLERNWLALRKIKLRQIEQEMAALQGQLDDLETQKKEAKPATSKPMAKGRPSEDRAKAVKKNEWERGGQVKSGSHVTEVIVFGRPEKRYYVRTSFLEKITWKSKTRTRILRDQPFDKDLAKKLLDDIKKSVTKAVDASPLGNLEAKIKAWAVREDCLLNALHMEIKWTGNQADAAKYAVSGEAHFFRFAASASAGINSWDLKKGQVEVGIKGSASFSMAEAKGSLNGYYPCQGGYPVLLSYKNAEGKMMHHPFGAFRLHGMVELFCFAGADAKAIAGATANYKPKEQPSGASILLGTPSVELARGGRVGLKADAFAGAQAGGTLSGALEWVSPGKEGKGAKQPGQQMTSTGAWSKLAEVKGDGNVAFGLGAGIDFGLTITSDRLTFNCKASLVFGPGAGGGFATVVDFEKIYEMFKLVCDALAEVDYRYLLSCSEQAFKYIAYGLYMVATSPSQAAGKAFEFGLDKIQGWWLDRTAHKKEAALLAENILRDQAVIINNQRVPLDKLPPETIGPMLYVLSESFIESWHEDQEKAIVLLVSSIVSWRQFIEVLEHMSANAEKVNAMKSLNRLNTLIDGSEQDEFNRFIHKLSVNTQTTVDSGLVAWTTKDPVLKRNVLLAARNSGLYDGIA